MSGDVNGGADARTAGSERGSVQADRGGSPGRYALLSDVHGNLPALEAVLEDLDDREEILGVYHLGDLVGYAPWPNEDVASLDRHGIPGGAGNYDSTTATRHDHCGCRYEDPDQEALAHESYAWTLEHVRVAYDVERAAREIEESGLPDAFAGHLREGRA